MKKYIYYFIIFVGISSVISETMYDFPKMKFLYATFYPEKYFKQEELMNWDIYYSDGNEGTDIFYYEGTLKTDKSTAGFQYRAKYIDALLLENGNIPVWFVHIGKAKITLVRTSNSYPKPYKSITSFTYIFFFLYSFVAIYRLIKLKS